MPVSEHEAHNLYRRGIAAASMHAHDASGSRVKRTVPTSMRTGPPTQCIRAEVLLSQRKQRAPRY